MPNTGRAPAPHAPAKSSPQDRRRFPRRAKPFQAVYWLAPDRRFPAVGLDISGGGICLLTQAPIPGTIRDLSIVVLVQEKPVPFTGVLKWADTITYKDREHYRYGIKLAQIADGDWDGMMNALGVQAELGAPASGSVLTAKQRDTLIPAKVQVDITAALVNKQRLDAPQADCLPLTEYKFEGYTMRKGVPFYRLTVRSKRRASGGASLSEFRTTILVPVEGTGVILAD